MRAWDPEEDTIIMEMVNTDGPKWKQIVKRLPGRTVSSVRNRYQRIEKGRKLREDPNVTLKNRCHLCGLPKRGHICMAKMGGGPQVAVNSRSPAIMAAQQAGGLNFGGAGPSALSLPMPDVAFGGPISSTRGGPSSSSGLMMAPPSQPALKRTRSGSRLVPAEPSVGGGGGPPQLQRSNTSFFNDLISADIFSPESSDFLKVFAESPAAGVVANDPTAPPSLRRVASGNGILDPPRMTRGVSQYLVDNGMAASTSPNLPMPSGAAALMPAPSNLSRQPSITRAGSFSRGPSGLSRQPSGAGLNDGPPTLNGRSVTSFMNDFIDTSAALDSAPPPSAVPSLAAGLSFSTLLADPVDNNEMPLLSGQPSVGRRSSPRGKGSPRW